MKLKQLDRFETIVRDAADRQRKWREQLVKNKAINEDLQVSTPRDCIYPLTPPFILRIHHNEDARCGFTCKLALVQ
jgi:hypothetical protein